MNACRDCKHCVATAFPGAMRCSIHMWSDVKGVTWDVWYSARTVRQNREPVRSIGAKCARFEAKG